MRTAKRSIALPAQLPPRLIDVDAAAAYLSMSIRHFKTYVQVTPLKIGSKILYDVTALDRWVDSQANTNLTHAQILDKLG